MNSFEIESWIKCLGQPHANLVSDSLIPDDELIELFAEIDELYLDVDIGISMSFWQETLRLESLHITLIKVVEGEEVYQNDLPPPYSLHMNRTQVLELFGEPVESSGPLRMPDPVGQVGGWDYYLLDPESYPNTKVQFQYLESLEVSAIVFTLIDKGHD